MAATLRAALLLGLLAPLAWDEAHPLAHRDAAAAWARGESTKVLSAALGHLRWHPWSRIAALDAARGFSRLDFAAWAEPYYRRVGLDRLGRADLHLRALALFRANLRTEAIAAYREILRQDPVDILAIRRLAAIEIAQGEYGEALLLARRLIQIPGGTVIGHTLAGTIAHDTGDTEHAVAELTQVLALDPSLDVMPLSPRSMFWSYLGQDLLVLGRAEEARDVLIRALGEGRYAGLASLLATAYRQLGELDQAERCWQLARDWEPKLPGPWIGLGRLALQRGRPEQAIALLTRAGELAPGDSGAIYSLSQARRRLGDHPEADRLQRRADLLRAASGSDATETMVTTPAPVPAPTTPPTDRRPAR